jgi:hypothetical protein
VNSSEVIGNGIVIGIFGGNRNGACRARIDGIGDVVYYETNCGTGINREAGRRYCYGSCTRRVCYLRYRKPEIVFPCLPVGRHPVEVSAGLIDLLQYLFGTQHRCGIPIQTTVETDFPG